MRETLLTRKLQYSIVCQTATVPNSQLHRNEESSFLKPSDVLDDMEENFFAIKYALYTAGSRCGCRFGSDGERVREPRRQRREYAVLRESAFEVRT